MEYKDKEYKKKWYQKNKKKQKEYYQKYYQRNKIICVEVKEL